MKIDCIIVEDEPLAAERLKSFTAKVPYLVLVAVFDNGVDALLYLQENKVDLLFLDIRLGEFSGIELIESLEVSVQVILTTAYQEYALKGYELKITDYLLKPYTFERFFQAVERAREQEIRAETKIPKDYFFIRTEHRLEKILFNEVLYIEGKRDYRKIHTLTRIIMTLETFREMETMLPQALICRVHKSYMVALNKIESIERERIRIKDIYIPVSETYKRSFMQLIGTDNS